MAKIEKIEEVKPKFKNRFTETGEKKNYGTKIKGESMTDTSLAEELDIKTMCKKYGLNSVLARTQVTEAMYGYDLTEATNFNERLEIRQRMEQYYNSMPAIVRKEFGDKFNKFYEMYATGDTEKMYKLGILERRTNETEQSISEQRIDTNTQSNNQNNSAKTTGNSENAG